MPRSPIISREALFMQLPDGTLFQLDWNLVDTSVGGMLEMRSFNVLGDEGSEVDRRDASYSRITVIDEHKMPEYFGTHGALIPSV